MSLINCIKKAGRRLNKKDTDAIMAYSSSGMSDQEAVEKHLSDIDSQLVELGDKAKEHGLPVSETGLAWMDLSKARTLNQSAAIADYEDSGVVMTERRADHLIDYFDPSKNKQGASLIDMSPEAYLELAPQNKDLGDDINQKAETGEIVPTFGMLDEVELKENKQPIYLVVRSVGNNKFKVVGHEGRHRMYALWDAGIAQVPVLLIHYESDVNDTLGENPVLIQQRGRLRVDDEGKVTKVEAEVPVLGETVRVSKENKAEIMERFGDKTRGPVLYQSAVNQAEKTPLEIHLSSVPGYNEYELPGLTALASAAKHDRSAALLLSDIARDSLKYLMGGIDADIQYTTATGVWKGGEEPALGVTVQFNSAPDAAALAALAKFATNFNQQQVHVLTPAIEGTDLTHDFDDSSYNTPVYRVTGGAKMSSSEIQNLITKFDLDGLTATEDGIEFYFVGDFTDANEVSRFEEKALRLKEFVEGDGRAFNKSVQRLWVYGDGGIPYTEIEGELRPAEGDQASETARRVAARLNDRDEIIIAGPGRITQEQWSYQNSIAMEYEAMPLNDLDNPIVRDAYEALAEEITKQFDAMPIKVEIFKGQGEPYASSQEMRSDILTNNHLYVLGTDAKTFGPPGVKYKDHPMLKMSAYNDINKQPMLVNDLFRAVHDYYAHSMATSQFGPVGEEQAWKIHMAMTSNPYARWALTTETRGQNSWVNFREEVADLPAGERPFAVQKVGLLPIEYTLTGLEHLDDEMTYLTRANEEVFPRAPYYSAMKRALNKAPDKANPEQWVALFTKAGVKPVEMDWMDVKGRLAEILKETGGKTLTKEQVKELVDEAGINLKVYNRAGLEKSHLDVEVIDYEDQVTFDFENDFEQIPPDPEFMQQLADELLEDEGYVYRERAAWLGQNMADFNHSEEIGLSDYIEKYMKEMSPADLAEMEEHIKESALAATIWDYENDQEADMQRKFTVTLEATGEEFEGVQIYSHGDQEIFAPQLGFEGGFDQTANWDRPLFEAQVFEFLENQGKIKSEAQLQEEYENTVEADQMNQERVYPFNVYADDKYGNSSWTTPGGTKYHETVVTMDNQIEPYRPDNVHFTGEGEGTAVVWVRADLRNGGESYFVQEVQSLRAMHGRDKGFRPSKQEMVKLREAVDVANEDTYKMLVEIAQWLVDDGHLNNEQVFMDGESNALSMTGDIITSAIYVAIDQGGYSSDTVSAVQSALQDSGYTSSASSSMAEDIVTFADNKFLQDAQFRGRAEDANQRLKEARDKIGSRAVPDFPFKKDWLMLGMKTAIRNAVLMGANQVTWTPGEMQAERYSLRTNIDSIKHQRNSDGTYYIYVEAGHKSIERDNLSEEDLRELVGRDATDQIVNREGEEDVSDSRQSIIDRGRGVEVFSGRDFTVGEGSYSNTAGVYYKGNRRALGQFGEGMSREGAQSYIEGSKNSWFVLFESGEIMGSYVNEQDATKFMESINREYFDNPAENAPRILKPEDMKMGGEGLIKLYDTILPRALGKYIKKFGSKVETKTVHIGEETSWSVQFDDGSVEGVFTEAEAIEVAAGLERAVKPVRMGESVETLGFDITDKMRTAVRAGQPLFQSTAVEPRGSLEFGMNGEHIINLFKGSDLSTFLHESGHVFLEMEKMLAREYGTTDNQKKLLEWLGADSFDDIRTDTEEGVEMHEKFARGFEAYLREGKAPSMALRDAFSAFRRWLTYIYKTIRNLDVELNDEIRDVFDRLLASDEEIELARNNPAYDEFFASKEAAGMTDEQWKKYQEQKDKAKEKAVSTLDQKLIKEIMNRKTQEWKEEREPLIAEEKERISLEAPYQVLSDLANEPIDYDSVKEIMGKVPGRLIGKAKKGGADPELYAEIYGYKSVKAMLTEITTVPTLKDAATAAAEARMIETYGDILNDGTVEMEAREAVHNEEQAKLLLAEMKQLGKKAKRPVFNRAQMKARAQDMIGSMLFSEIKPDRYYRNEVRAAQNAAKATTPEEQLHYKTQQLINHYLYKEALAAKQAADKYRKYTADVAKRDYSTVQVHPEYVQMMKVLARMYDMRKNTKRLLDVEKFLHWHATQMQDENDFIRVELMDPTLVMAADALKHGVLNQFTIKTWKEMTLDELRGHYEMLKHLRYVGGQMADLEKAEFKAERDELITETLSNGGKDMKDPDEPSKWDGQFNKAKNFMLSLVNLRNLIRRLDGMDDNGLWYQKIFTKIETANDAKMVLMERLVKEHQEELNEVERLTINKGNKKTITKENGGELTLSSEGRMMLALYWGTESSREALMLGHNLTEGDVQSMLEEMSPEELNLVNKIWKLNESLWPDLSAMSVRLYGVAPSKVEATPFVVNGVTLTGGHMRLFYAGTSEELDTKEAKLTAEAPMSQYKAGSLHERVGSGGKKVLLDKNNIYRAMTENVHAITFAEATRDVGRFLNNKDVETAVTQKHGTEFYNVLVKTIDGVMTTKREKNYNEALAAIARLVRHAATFKHLAYSIRNTVQQISALPIARQEVGGINMTKAAMSLLANREEQVARVHALSVFMANRAKLVNREASEQLDKVTGIGPWDTFKQFGFAPQTIMDSLIAYPVWIARYDQAMEEHGDSDRASIQADQSVAESVGSGSDMHMGAMFQSKRNEFTKMITVFGSWFNAYYNRVYKSAYSGDRVLDMDLLQTITTTPLLAGVLAALLIGDGPDDDEEWWLWAVRTHGAFMIATLPLLRDVVSAFRGFAPSSPAGTGVEGIARIYQETISVSEGKQSPTQYIIDVAKAGTYFVVIPGSGQVIRMADYWESYEQGKEPGFNMYQMVTEGKTRQK